MLKNLRIFLLDATLLRDSRWAMTAPWPYPASVTLWGLPPNSAMACWTHDRARLTSARPKLPGSFLVSSDRNPRMPVLQIFKKKFKSIGWDGKETCTLQLQQPSPLSLICCLWKTLLHLENDWKKLQKFLSNLCECLTLILKSWQEDNHRSQWQTDSLSVARICGHQALSHKISSDFSWIYFYFVQTWS